MTQRRRRTMKGVLGNFLGTYTSRYSDFDGYWIFGLFVENLTDMRIDLLNPIIDPTDTAPIAAAISLAASKFIDQVAKGGQPIASIKEASLRITRVSDLKPAAAVVNGRISAAYHVRFLAQVVFPDGKAYVSKRLIIVAPHDPTKEHRRTRRN